MVHSAEGNLSVFEFIYIDRNRVSNLLAQLDPNGVMTSLASTSGLTKDVAVGIGVEGEAGIPFVKKGSASGDAMGSISHGTLVDKQYDTSDVAPQTLLSLLAARSLIERNVKRTKIGGIGLFSGKLMHVDPGLASGGWDRLLDDSVPSGTEVIAEKIFSDPIAFLSGSGAKVWIPIQRSSWQLGHSSALTHGPIIPGKWSFLGFVSKTPSEETSFPAQQFFPDGHMFPAMIQGMHEMKAQIGCPSSFYSITPLLGFREVSTTDE